MGTKGYKLACPVDKLPPRGKKTLTVGDQTVVVIVCDSQVYAVLDHHPEKEHGLAHGKVLNGVLTLPDSGAHYDLRTGQYLGGCAWALAHNSLPVLDTKIADGNLYVSL
jgi:nitrite reductase/ring-hydroxylating ferredoxin subunit